MMLEPLRQRLIAIARRREARARDAAAERLAAALPGLRVSRTDEGVAIEGRGLWRDARLRWIGSLLR